jgi:hypothetical protein
MYHHRILILPKKHIALLKHQLKEKSYRKKIEHSFFIFLPRKTLKKIRIKLIKNLIIEN